MQQINVLDSNLKLFHQPNIGGYFLLRVQLLSQLAAVYYIMPVSVRQDDRLYLKLILTDTYRCQSSNGRHDAYSLRSRNDLAQCEAKRPIGKLKIKDREGNAQDTYTQVGNSQVCNKVTCNCNRKIIERSKLMSIVIGRIAMVTSGNTRLGFGFVLVIGRWSGNT